MIDRTSVLLVEDSEAFVDALEVGLAREGFRVIVARTGPEALERFDAEPPDVVLLDLMLPELSGLDVCRELRARSSVPIIMVTAKSDEIDAVVGLEVGADDYVTKPYRMRELVARIRAVLRRSSGSDVSADEETERLAAGGIVVDLDRHEASVDGRPIALPLKEFELLSVLVENAGRVLERSTLITRVWGADYVGDTETLDVHIKRLRSKVEPEPGQPRRIVTIRGLGYKFVPEAADGGVDP